MRGFPYRENCACGMPKTGGLDSRFKLEQAQYTLRQPAFLASGPWKKVTVVLWWVGDFGRHHCTALHCTVLYCTALQCTALHCRGPVEAILVSAEKAREQAEIQAVSGPLGAEARQRAGCFQLSV